MANSTTLRIENLNALVLRTTKFNSNRKMAPDLGLHNGMKMNYSAIHKENEILEDHLEDHLLQIKKNERRAMEEKGGELDEIRRQMDVIIKLQEAVNSRNPCDSTDILSTARMTKFGRQWGEKRPNRALAKIQAERNKFSSKNLFNGRKISNSPGIDFNKLVPTSGMQIPSDNEDDGIYSNTSKIQSSSAKPQKHIQNKGYLKETFSSLAGSRPMTAGVAYERVQKEDDILPPRAKSAVLRSRSRRQLELLCRVTPNEDELEVTPDFKVDWKVINEKRRRLKLQQLKEEHAEIQDRVLNFLRDVDTFNKRPISAQTSIAVRSTSMHWNHSDV
uniref:Uncharacterized protein n=1 Tax=Arion vulgaris TaxID=1028688 RepID=A0A0B6ZJZ6_9EUPU